MNSVERKTILLVEDEAITAMFEKQQLEKYGYSVHHVTTGKKAVQTILDNVLPVDLILMDIDLGSGIDGTQAAEQILNQKDIPVVFLSSHTEPEVVEKTEKITSYGYVVKNSGIVVLDASIKMACRLFEANKKMTDEVIERKRTEAKLSESEALLSGAQELAHIGSWQLDLTANIVSCSDEICRIFGCELQEFASTYEALLDFVHPEDRAAVDEAYSRSLREGSEGCALEYRIVRRDSGEVRFIHVRCNHERDDVGAIIQSIGIAQDITERKRAEAVLRESDEKYRLQFMNMNSYNSMYEVVTDNEGKPYDFRFLIVNQAYEKFVGIKASELIGRTLLEVYPETEQYWIEKMIEAVSTGMPIQFESFSKVMNTYIEINLFTPQKGQLVMTTANITKRKQAEDEIQKQLTEKETLLREVHHRVKNNISNIESFLTLQADSTDNPEVKAAIKDAISRVQSTRILYDKLLLSKDLREISMKNYIKDLIDSLLKVFVDKDNIIIEKHISEFRILSNQAITIGIIINELLTNVFKHSFKDRDKGIVSISIQKTENNVTLIIQDNGIGADERIMENKSPGFGLTIVKMLVEQLQGTYSFVNKNGTRSVIQFKI